jgi:hypothetical protein
MVVVIKNNSKSAQVISDLNKAWGAAGSGSDIQTVSDREWRSSAHLQSVILSGEMEKVDTDYAAQLLADRRKASQEATSDDVTLELDTESEMISYKCFGLKRDGSPCDAQVFAVNNGTEYPLCVEHEDQKNRCKWDATLKTWLPAVKRDSKLKDETAVKPKAKAAAPKMSDYQTVVDDSEGNVPLEAES